MAVERWRPLRQMAAMTEAMHRLLEEPFVALRPAIGAMGVDLYEQDENFILEAALPGISPDQIEISVTGSSVTISGEVPCEIQPAERVTYLYHQRPCGSFRDTFTLPTEVDVNNVQATFEHGLLRLTLPKVAAARPRRIEIQAAGARPAVQAPAREQPAAVSQPMPAAAQPTTGQAKTTQLFQRIQQGMDVCDRSGNKFGTVGRVYSPAAVGQPSGGGRQTGQGGATTAAQPYLQVDTGFLGLGKDVYIPGNAVTDIRNNCVIVDVERDELDRMGWDQRPSFLQQ